MSDYSDIIFLMAGMVLFSVLVNNTNRSFVRNTTMYVEAQVEYNAIAVGQSIIDEARTKAFDAASVGSGNRIGNPDVLLPAQIPSAFTAPADLGPEAGEIYPNFNDFDDFNGLTLTRNNGFGDFEISVSVFYVTEVNPRINAGARTSMKRMEVTISHDNLSNDVTLSYIKSYF
ncbi:MAG: hypothetical protein JJU41_08830 [Bacteroidetes bacterium]|nr:hypothetical protein [Bacteroidota bacterium]MCH8525466.1 hypothetical protein [Balneolales bacterium]